MRAAAKRAARYAHHDDPGPAPCPCGWCPTDRGEPACMALYTPAQRDAWYADHRKPAAWTAPTPRDGDLGPHWLDTPPDHTLGTAAAAFAAELAATYFDEEHPS